MTTTANYVTDFRCIKDEVSPEEWQARVDLAACYRLVDRFGMTDLTYNHITSVIPGTDHILVNLYGLMYSEVTASSLIKMDLDGNVIWKPDTDYGRSVSGYVIHGAIHRARPDAVCVIHTHSQAGMAVSAMAEGLLPITQTSMRFHNHIGYHDYEGPAIDEDEQRRLVEHLGEHNAMILRNHGLITCGPSVGEAFNLMYHLDLACRTQVDVMAARAQVLVPDTEVVAHTALQYQPTTRRPYGVLEWPAMMRLLKYEAKNSPFPAYDS
jgi:ribulose-5-phosphate 4-epimerase/fuculose-1-phosphate aldolase